MLLHRLGVGVIPMKHLQKKPAVKWKPFQRQRADEDTLRRWFGDMDTFNIGMAAVCGQVSGGLLIRDFDKPEAYKAWKARHSDLAAVLPTLQAKRGPHVWFRCRDYLPDGAKSFVRNLGDGELRGDGHYALAPPSIHASGSPYRWIVPPGDSIPFASLSDLDIPPLLGRGIQVVHVFPSGPSEAFMGDRDDGDDRRRKEIHPSIHPSPPIHSSSSSSSKISRVQNLADALRVTVPRVRGERNHCIFQFARHLKALPQYRFADSNVLEPEFRQWYDLALPFIGTKGFEWNFQEFERAWHQSRVPAGSGSLQNAFSRAKEATDPVESVQFKSDKLRLLVRLCRELQVEAGERAFFLSSYDAAAALGLDGHLRAWKWLRLLCHRGILRLERSGTRGAGGRANEYRYLAR